MKKKKILFQSDFSLAKTGFGRNAKAILSYLYKTGKYDITHYCCGTNWSNPECKRTPWRSVGVLPDTQQEMDQLNKDPHVARAASYGAHNLDRIIKEVKPDVYIAAQDIWGVDFAVDKPWFKDINSVIWTTLDSLPILPSAVDKADKIKNYWIWSDFATKELHKLGHTHVKTVHGAVDESAFKPLSKTEKFELRKKHNLNPNTFITGFVFRNQLRKSVPNLLEGYSLWKKKHNINHPTQLLLHTHFSEGWNIMKLAGEYGIHPQEILTTYVCKECKSYEVKNFTGQDLDCKHCGAKKSQTTTNTGCGITEEELNEVYNLMDVYCHPFTSGGQEIPIQEAKYAGLITLVTDYSCGEEMCQDDAYSLTLKWSEYREQGTEFRKASTKPDSIASQINRVFKMPQQKRDEWGKKARDWAIKNFSTYNVGGLIEKEIDSMPDVDFSKISFEEKEKQPYAELKNIEDNTEWLIHAYKEILLMDVDKDDDGHKYWMGEFKKGATKRDIENYFRNVAVKDNEKNKKSDFSDLLDKDDEGKRLLYCMPESIGDIYLSTSLFKSIKELYPEYNLYVAVKQEYFELLEGNKHVHKVIPFFPQMDNLPWLEGQGEHKGYFEIAFLPYGNTQRFLTYLHNAKDKLAYDINY